MTKTVPRNTDRADRIVNFLNRTRKTQGLSVEDLEGSTGIPKRTLDRKLTTATDTLTLRELILICDALDVRIWESVGLAS